MSRILIVDDEPVVRDVLRACLDDGTHELTAVESGVLALESVARQQPDLVLCDVMLPGMDGFEITRRLKQIARDEFLPVIMVTAMVDHDVRMRGLESGADEFLTKPIDPQELQMRVANLLALREKEQALLRRYVEHSELLRFRDEMSAMIVHDLKSPMSVILSSVEYAMRQENIDPEAREALEDALAASRRTLGLIGNLLDVTRMEAGKMATAKTRVRLGTLVREIVRQRASLAERRQLTVECDLANDHFAEVDVDMVTRMFENMIDNALRHTPIGGKVKLWSKKVGGGLEICVANNGPAIPRHMQRLIFEKFGQQAQGVGRMSLGLGLYFCRLVSEAHGGSIRVEETSEYPAVFVVHLPVRTAGTTPSA
jgi:two-component system, sensor histidine kinase and response regulator